MAWEKRWREGNTGWDAGASPPILVELVERDALPVGRALVPGAGAGYDVLTLASPERRVTGLDVAPTAVRRFETLREQVGVPETQAHVEAVDFFHWEPGARFDLVWDYTFLCALPPAERPAWATRMAELVSPSGELITLIFPVNGGPPAEGPPYPMTPALVRDLLEPHFEPIELRPVERSHPGREGKEWLARWRKLGDGVVA